ncbi:hypothetical protein SAMD00019534_004950 [Acytostelium subglobosum LB1]|uniref:hypothetical protein n=1 Tax=Acytostelium subglobosum LB1 TaxID=1410327 RepID=UPI000644E2E4|nr:hypothetical protein SAMD00019534_004950 [Acytostelium subglobosum LB1]GAM17320.1 hypothetical protein SAMD00019534_004950 [Acytostelium subglobosum LB1]|eukprot:XP_012759382.1 hypothetical protein SAMD00019534_004950 [Acytostelium subglobosum LB1]
MYNNNKLFVLFVCLCVWSLPWAKAQGNPCDDVRNIDIDFDNSLCLPTRLFSVSDYGYDSITIQPSTGVQKINYTSHTLFTVSTSGTYTFFVTKGQCVQNYTTDVRLASITITQPKCYGGPVQVLVTGLENTNAGYRVDGSQYTYTNDSYVYQGIPVALPVASLRISALSSSCRAKFLYDVSNAIRPKLSIVHPVCDMANGRVSVINAAPNNWNTCNNSYALQTFTINGGVSLPDGLTLNGKPISAGVQMTIPQGDISIDFAGLSCPNQRPYTYSTGFIPVTHSIGKPATLPSCTANKTATFTYPRDFSTLSLNQGALNSNHQVEVYNGESVVASTSCDTAAVYIGYPTVAPIYSLSYTEPSCIGTYTLSVLNYVMYESVVITNNAAPVDTVTAVQGVMKGLYVGQWTVTVVDKGCGTDKARNYSFLVQEQDSTFHTEYIIFDIEDPVYPATCGGNFSATVTPIYKGVRSTLSTFVNYNNTNSGTYYQDIPFVTATCSRRNIQYSKQASPKHATITIKSQAPCLQSYGEVYFNYTLPVSSIIINDTNFLKASGAIYQFPVGTTRVRFGYPGPGGIVCGQDEVVTIVALDTTTLLSVKVTPQTSYDCSVPRGQISFTSPWSDFNSAWANSAFPFVDGTAIIGSTDSAFVVFDHKTCGQGIINDVPVPTDDNITITVEPVRTSGCPDPSNTAANSAVLSVIQGGLRLPSKRFNVDGAQYIQETGVIYGMPTGNVTIEIVANACKWKHTFTQKFDPRPSFRIDVLQMPTTDSDPTGVAEVVVLRDDVFIQSVFATNSYCYDMRYIRGWSSTEAIDIQVQDYFGCTYAFLLNVSSTINEPKYTITPPTSCGSTMAKIQFDKSTMDKYEVYVVNTAPDATGVTYFDYMENVYIRYRPWIQFSRKPTDIDYNNIEIVGLPTGPNTLPTNLDVKYSVTGESCAYSRDGSVVITDADPVNYQYSLTDPEANTQADTFISGTTITFQFLSSGSHQLSVYSRANTYCAKVMSIIVPTSEPKVTIVAPSVCDATVNHSSISFKVSPASLLSSTTFKINGQSASASNNAPLAAGTYSAEATVSAGVCSRYFIFTATIENKFIEAYAMSYLCGQLLYKVTAHSNLDYTIKLLDSAGNEVTSATHPISVNGDYANYQGLATGSYQVVSTDVTGCARTTPLIQVTGCPTQAPSTTGQATTGQSTTTGGGPTTTGPTTTGPTTTTTTGLNSSSQTSVSTLLLVIIIASSTILNLLL